MITSAVCITVSLTHHGNGIQGVEDGEEKDVISGRFIRFLQCTVVGCYTIWRSERERGREREGERGREMERERVSERGERERERVSERGEIGTCILPEHVSPYTHTDTHLVIS